MNKFLLQYSDIELENELNRRNETRIIEAGNKILAANNLQIGNECYFIDRLNSVYSGCVFKGNLEKVQLDNYNTYQLCFVNCEEAKEPYLYLKNIPLKLHNELKNRYTHSPYTIFTDFGSLFGYTNFSFDGLLFSKSKQSERKVSICNGLANNVIKKGEFENRIPKYINFMLHRFDFEHILKENYKSISDFE